MHPHSATSSPANSCLTSTAKHSPQSVIHLFSLNDAVGLQTYFIYFTAAFAVFVRFTNLLTQKIKTKITHT